MRTQSSLAVTVGEPSGVGVDLCVMMAHKPFAHAITVIADSDVLYERAELRKTPLRINRYEPHNLKIHSGDGSLTVLHISTQQPVKAGVLDFKNSAYVIETLQRAAQGVQQGEFCAIVTCPVHKGIINRAGIKFSGHTEFFAEISKTPHVVMMLAGKQMRVALATTHMPIKDVPNALTASSLCATLRIIHAELKEKFGVSNPRIAVLGLNPHAGEQGHLGTEELLVIEPVLRQLRDEGMQLLGPLPADTAFTPFNLTNTDVILAMYHDQGLPVLKYACFGASVNVTLGLPFIRTSVDHGTALDIVASQAVKPESLFLAIEMAIDMTHLQS